VSTTGASGATGGNVGGGKVLKGLAEGENAELVVVVVVVVETKDRGVVVM